MLFQVGNGRTGRRSSQQALGISAAHPPVAEPGDGVGIEVSAVCFNWSSTPARVDRGRLAVVTGCLDGGRADLERAGIVGECLIRSQRIRLESRQDSLSLGAGLVVAADFAQQPGQMGPEQ